MAAFLEPRGVFEDEFSNAFTGSLPPIKLEELLSEFRLHQQDDAGSDVNRSRLIDEALSLVLIESDLSSPPSVPERRSYAATASRPRTGAPETTLDCFLPDPKKKEARKGTCHQNAPERKCPQVAETVSTMPLELRAGALLELITDERQLASFFQLKEIYGGHFEDWFILDILMKYNFDMEASTCSLHESAGPAAVSYASAAAGISSVAHLRPRQAEAPQHEQNSRLLAFKLPPRPASEQVPSFDSSQTMAWDQLFGWRRSVRDGEAAREILLRNNSHISVDIDHDSGQLMFVGFRQSEGHKKNKKKQAPRQDSVAREHTVKIDMHGATVKVALEMVRSTICFFVMNGLNYTSSVESHTVTSATAQAVFVVGKGMHSKCGVPVLFLAITRFLGRRDIMYILSENNAEITVSMKWNQSSRRYLPSSTKI